ncbi:DNA/RNA non-specific endonuclease [Novilysobacter antarcticus]|uniref:DNA/RNA non-specific endonuclease n=1 Tax=Novilysobacter antarcticus TaxID=2862543 RepID=UPI001C9957A9|nr:DNA/RNA non-specific endonuclease [Lysobacter antarcticus]
MSLTPSLHLPLPPQPWGGALRGLPGLLRPDGGDGARLDKRILAADPAQVSFDLEPASVRTQDVKDTSSNTTYTTTADMMVRAPDRSSTRVPVRYEVAIRNENATPEQMRTVNPFDPATIPDRTRIEIHGNDYVGTALEPAFSALAKANGLDSISDLRLSLEMLDKGKLRVMSGSEQLFDAPRDGGPSSYPADRQDFTRHTTLLADPTGSELGGYSRMLLTGKVPDSTVVLAEAVNGNEIHGTVTEAGSGEVNDITWTLDAEGRPASAEATLTWEPSSKGRESDRIEANAQSGFRKDNDMKGTPDDVGHIIAYRFANGHGSVNMFPQFGLFNRGAYARMEQEWGDWLAKGMEVSIEVTLVGGTSQRPDEVHVDYKVIDPDTGAVVYDPTLIAFANADGQTFDAIADAGMDEMIDRATA